MAKRSTPKDIPIAARITFDQAVRLDAVQAMAPALPRRSDAVRRLIDMVTADALKHAQPDAAEGKEVPDTIFAPDDVTAVLSALEARTRAYSELSKQVRAIGHLLNQLTRLGHQIEKYGKAGTIPDAAVDAVGRKVASALDQMATMAEQDAHVEAVVRACRS